MDFRWRGKLDGEIGFSYSPVFSTVVYAGVFFFEEVNKTRMKRPSNSDNGISINRNEKPLEESFPRHLSEWLVGRFPQHLTSHSSTPHERHLLVVMWETLESQREVMLQSQTGFCSGAFLSAWCTVDGLLHASSKPSGFSVRNVPFDRI